MSVATNPSMKSAGAAMAVLAQLTDQLAKEGVTTSQLRGLVEDPVRFEALVALIRQPERSWHDTVAQYATLAEEPNPRGIGLLFRKAPDLAERYVDDREGLDFLLTRVSQPTWRRAAIIMAYGLGETGRVYTIPEIARILQRSEVTVENRLSTGELTGKLRQANRVLENRRRQR